MAPAMNLGLSSLNQHAILQNAEKQQLYVSVVFKLQQKVNFCQKITVQ